MSENNTEMTRFLDQIRSLTDQANAIGDRNLSRPLRDSINELVKHVERKWGSDFLINTQR